MARFEEDDVFFTKKPRTKNRLTFNELFSIAPSISSKYNTQQPSKKIIPVELFSSSDEEDPLNFDMKWMTNTSQEKNPPPETTKHIPETPQKPIVTEAQKDKNFVGESLQKVKKSWNPKEATKPEIISLDDEIEILDTPKKITKPKATKLPKKRTPVTQMEERPYKIRKKENNEIWVEKHKPKDQKELCVQPQKFRDVEDKIKRAFKGEFRLIVLGGPPGSGKTASLDLICQQGNIQMVQWTNPSRTTYLDSDFKAHGDYETALGPFIQFMKREKYPTLDIQTKESMLTKNNKPKRQLVVVEDMPNLHDMVQRLAFEDVIKSLVGSTKPPPWPVVFIISDTTTDDNSAERLFSHVKGINTVQIIQFNPVTEKRMTTILKSICTRECVKIHDSTLKNIYEQSGGDIRNAINTLQFEAVEINRSMKDKSAKEEGRDISLSLFHSLGKVLYNKRLDADTSGFGPLDRPPMKSVPHEFRRHVHVDSGVFNEFLAENYLNFFGDIHDVSMAAEYLSQSIHLTTSNELWKKTQLDDMAWYVAAHGTMFANIHPTPRRYTPLVKPHHQTIYKATQHNMELLKDIFSPTKGNNEYSSLVAHSWANTGLMGDILPFVALSLRIPPYNPRGLKITASQKPFLQMMSQYSKEREVSQVTRGGRVLDKYDNYFQQYDEEQKRHGNSLAEDSKEFHRLNALVLAEDDIEPC